MPDLMHRPANIRDILVTQPKTLHAQLHEHGLHQARRRVPHDALDHVAGCGELCLYFLCVLIHGSSLAASGMRVHSYFPFPSFLSWPHCAGPWSTRHA